MGVFDTFFVFGVSSVDFLFARELGVFILAVPQYVKLLKTVGPYRIKIQTFL
jgi:hypothetical protein